MISTKIKIPGVYTKIVYVYILHRRRYYTLNGTSIRYAPHPVQNVSNAAIILTECSAT